MGRMNTQASNHAGPLPLERSYLSLQEAFGQAIALEVALAGRRSEAVEQQGEGDVAGDGPGEAPVTGGC